MKQVKEEKIKQFLVRTTKETFKVSIPDTWKVTFGPGAPPNNKNRYDTEKPWCLRFYEAENRQRACFTGVLEFRDVSLPIERQVTSEKGEVRWQTSTDGSEEHKQVQREKKFVKDEGDL